MIKRIMITVSMVTHTHVAANSCYVGVRIIYLSINPPSNTNSLS